MNTPDSTRRFPTFRRTWRALLFLLVCGVTLIALFYAIENWRGHRAWSRYQQEATARLTDDRE